MTGAVTVGESCSFSFVWLSGQWSVVGALGVFLVILWPQYRHTH